MKDNKSLEASTNFLLQKVAELEDYISALEKRILAVEMVTQTGDALETDSWYSLDGVPEAYRKQISKEIDKLKGGN